MYTIIYECKLCGNKYHEEDLVKACCSKTKHALELSAKLCRETDECPACMLRSISGSENQCNVDCETATGFKLWRELVDA